MKILKPLQKEILQAIAQSPLGKDYVWTGGTALAHRLNHRYSVDLDFFSEKEQSPEIFVAQIRDLQKKLNLTEESFEEKLNRKILILSQGKEKVQLEFVYFPFQAIEKPKTEKDLSIKIDSLQDIAVNKILSAFQRKEPKDVYDLYILCQEHNFDLSELLDLTKRKFDVHIDYASLIAKILKSAEQLDKLKPLLIKAEDNLSNKVKTFFQDKGNKFLAALL